MASTAAQKAKDLGNASFKSGEYAVAVGHYTTAILADPQNPTYPLNRAAAYLKLGKHDDAERDCSTVLKLDQSSVKGWFRRGQARSELAKFDGAINDFQQVLRLEPTNAAAQKEVERLHVLVRKNAVVQPKKPVLSLDSLPTDTPPATPVKRRRIPIEIIDPISSNNPSANPKEPVELLTPVASRSLLSSSPGPSATPANEPSSSTQRAIPSNPPKVTGGIFRPNGQHTIFKSSAPNNASRDIPTGAAQPNAPAPNNQPRSLSKAAAAESSPSGPLTQASLASSLFAFSKSWESSSSSQDRWELLLTVPPHVMPSLFKTSLEASMLVSLLRVFVDKLQSPNVTAGEKLLISSYMGSLPRVARFKTVTLFFSPQERKQVTDIFELLPNNPDLKAAWGP